MKKSITIVLFFLLLPMANIFAQYTFDWMQGSGNYAKTSVMSAVDLSDNIIVTGYWQNYQTFTRKYDISGNLLWEVADSSGIQSKYVKPNWINCDANNNILVVGNQYSYSSSTQVLFEEMKYAIDLYVAQLNQYIVPQEATEEIGRGANAGNSDGSQTAVGTGSDPLPPGWVINGPVVVQPLDQNTGNQVQGTISINEPVVVTMVTLGGTAQGSFTNSLITFQKGNKPMNSQLSRESYAQRNQSIAAPITILSVGAQANSASIPSISDSPAFETWKDEPLKIETCISV